VTFSTYEIVITLTFGTFGFALTFIAWSFTSLTDISSIIVISNGTDTYSTCICFFVGWTLDLCLCLCWVCWGRFTYIWINGTWSGITVSIYVYSPIFMTCFTFHIVVTHFTSFWTIIAFTSIPELTFFARWFFSFFSTHTSTMGPIVGSFINSKLTFATFWFFGTMLGMESSTRGLSVFISLWDFSTGTFSFGFVLGSCWDSFSTPYTTVSFNTLVNSTIFTPGISFNFWRSRSGWFWSS